MRRGLGIIAAICLWASVAHAQQFYIINGPPTGKIILNGFDPFGNTSAFAFNNFAADTFSYGNAATNYPTLLNSNQYPADTASLSVLIEGIYAMPATACLVATPCILEWTGTQGTSLHPGIQLSGSPGGFTINNSSSVCGNSSAFVSGALTSNLSTFGTNGCIEFYFNTAPHGTLIYEANAAYSGLGGVHVYLLSNYAAQQQCNAGTLTSCFNPDFITAMRAQNPLAIRPGDWSVMNGNATSSVGLPVTSFCYLCGYWNPANNVGTFAGGDTYTATLAGAMLTDGQQLQGQFTNANTTTSPCLELNGGGCIPIVTMSATAPVIGGIGANAFETLTYDQTLNKWLYLAGPVNRGVPLPIIVALANLLNVDLWYNCSPHMADNCTDAGTYIYNNLNQNLTFFGEVGDEWWNFGQAVTTWANTRGATLGFNAGNARQYQGFYALRVRQVMANLTTIWAGRPSKLKRILALMFSSTVATANMYRIQGADLCGTSCGNSSYQTLVGVDYNVAPNRPIDFSDGLSYAVYSNGAVLGAYTGTYAVGDLSACSAPGTNSGGLQCAADNYALGTTASIAAALAWVDNDARQGTQNGALGGHTLLGLSALYSPWNTVAVSYSVPIYDYEGGFQGLAPTVSQCGSIGFPGTASVYCGTGKLIDLMLQGWKNNSLFKQFVLDSFNAILAQSPSGSAVSWYTFAYSGQQWSEYPTTIYSTPYQSFNAIEQFDGP